MLSVDVDKLEMWLESTFGEFRTYRDDNYLVCSPFKSDRKFKLSISVSKRCFHCWKSDSHGPLWRLVMRMDNCSKHDAIEKVYETSVDINKFDDVIQSLQNKVRMTQDAKRQAVAPETFRFLSLDDKHQNNVAAIRYCLYERKIDPFKWRFGYCTEHFYHHVIIPCFDADGGWIYWTARSLKKDDNLRYINPSKEKYKIEAEKAVFTRNWNMAGKSVFLTEGIFDAIALSEIGLHSVGLLGKVLTFDKFQHIHHAREIVIALDSDEPGVDAANKMEASLQSNGFNNVRYVFPPSGLDWAKFYAEDRRGLSEYVPSNVKSFDLTSKISFILK